jgi:hypothetical protein
LFSSTIWNNTTSHFYGNNYDERHYDAGCDEPADHGQPDFPAKWDDEYHYRCGGNRSDSAHIDGF